MPLQKRKRPRRGPSAEILSKDRIVATALALIDDEGLDGFSMRSLADALGVYPTAIYWYVPNRNTLLAEVVAQALSEIVPEDSGDWQIWLKTLFRRYRRSVQKHPNIAPLIGAQLVSNAGVGPAVIDRILTVLLHAGFRDDHLVQAYNAVIAVQVGFVTLEFAPAPQEDTERWATDLKTMFGQIDSVLHPVLAQYLPRLENRAFILRWQNGATVPLDTSFELFIDIAVRGLEERLKQKPEHR
jgi:AcrR family transcriptional regulator